MISAASGNFSTKGSTPQCPSRRDADVGVAGRGCRKKKQAVSEEGDAREENEAACSLTLQEPAKAEIAALVGAAAATIPSTFIILPAKNGNTAASVAC